jgi:hypothetical protein
MNTNELRDDLYTQYGGLYYGIHRLMNILLIMIKQFIDLQIIILACIQVVMQLFKVC